MLRSSRDIVWRYTHSEPPSLPKATPSVPPFVFSAMERLVSEDCGETVEIAFDVQRTQRCRERQRGIPCEEVAAGITGRVQM